MLEEILTLPQHTLYRLHPLATAALWYASVLCLSTLYTGCIIIQTILSGTSTALPQHTLYRLHPALAPLAYKIVQLCLSTLYTGCIT